MNDHSKEFLEKLFKYNLITQEKAKDLLEESKKLNKTLQILVDERKIIPEDAYLKILGEIAGYPYIDIEKIDIDEKHLRELPEEAVRHYRFISFDLKDNVLKVGMVNVEDEEAVEALRFITQRKGYSLQIYLISASAFKKVFHQYENLERKVEEALTEVEKQIPLAGRKKEGVIFAEPIVAEAPISKIVGVIIRYAIESKASDIHIEPLDNTVKVRFRVDGELHALLFIKKEFFSQIISRLKILSRMKIDEQRVPQDGRFHVIIENRKIDFRVSTFPTVNGEKIVLRILDPTISVDNLTGLGFLGRNLEIVNKVISLPYGMVLSSGPTGSGKTTTLYTLLKFLNTEDSNIISLEDPVEYFIEGINQSQIMPEIGYTFATGLRHILRQDPDIILVGEIRDSETASLALHAALTGHLLLSSIHTNDVIGIVPRLIDMGIEKYLIPSTLSIGIAQRLARKLCDVCKEKYEPNSNIKELILTTLKNVSQDEIKKYGLDPNDLFVGNVYGYKAKGCRECGNKGTKGRVGIFETLEMNAKLEEIIVSVPSESKIKQVAFEEGMITMFQDGLLKVLNGTIEISELLRVAKVNY